MLETWRPPDGATVLEDTTVEPGMPWSGTIGCGEFLTLIDLEGRQAVDFLCYSSEDPAERYHAPNTIKIPGKIYLCTGSVLRSSLARPMMTLVEDSCGNHDTIFGCCSFEVDDVRYGARNERSCQLNFETELARRGIGKEHVVPNVNFFMRVPVEPDGAARIVDGDSKPNDRVTLRAEMPVLAVLSNCPEALNPATGGRPTPIRVAHWRGSLACG